MLKGRHVLSDAELLAILIGTGSRYESAVDICKRILADYDNLDELMKCKVGDLKKYKGMGEAKAISIMAALELGKRCANAKPAELVYLRSSEDAYKMIAPVLTDLQHEEFWVLLVNRANQIMRKDLISRGGMSTTVVDPKMVFKTALEHGAGAVVLCHNHPSGTAKPSDQDMKLTRRIFEGAQILDISLIDHIIVGAKTYFSFADKGLL